MARLAPAWSLLEMSADSLASAIDGRQDSRGRLILGAAAAFILIATFWAPKSARHTPHLSAAVATAPAALTGGSSMTVHAIEEIDCGSVPVPDGADCFWTDCGADICTSVCINPSPTYGSDVKEAIRRDYSWSWAFWRAGGTAGGLPATPRVFMLDIGANIGVTLLGAARAGRRVLAFEPAPVNLRYLNASVCLNGFEKLVEVVSAAVGAESGTVHFAEHPTRGDNSAMNAATAGMSIAGATREIEVPIWAIDDFVAANPRWAAADCALVKIDVQGFELRVLEGARQFLLDAGAARPDFTVRAEIDARLEMSTLGVAGGAAKFMAELGFESYSGDGGEGNDMLWRPKRKKWDRE